MGIYIGIIKNDINPNNTARKIYNSARGILGEFNLKYEIDKTIELNEMVIWVLQSDYSTIEKIVEYYPEIEFKKA